jgi:hypothetical protein
VAGATASGQCRTGCDVNRREVYFMRKIFSRHLRSRSLRSSLPKRHTKFYQASFSIQMELASEILVSHLGHRREHGKMVQCAAFVDGDLGLGWRNRMQIGRLVREQGLGGRKGGEYCEKKSVLRTTFGMSN